MPRALTAHRNGKMFIGLYCYYDEKPYSQSHHDGGPTDLDNGVLEKGEPSETGGISDTTQWNTELGIVSKWGSCKGGWVGNKVL